MEKKVKTIIFCLSLFLANSVWVSQAGADLDALGSDILTISVSVNKEKDFLFLNIQADETRKNPIFSCEFSLKYNGDLLQFIEYQPRKDWLKRVSEQKNKLEIIQSWPYQYNYWIIGEKFHLGTFKFKLIKKPSFVEFVFENPIVIELGLFFINPKVNDQVCWPKRIRITF